MLEDKKSIFRLIKAKTLAFLTTNRCRKKTDAIRLSQWKIISYLFRMFFEPCIHSFESRNGLLSLPKLIYGASRIFWLKRCHCPKILFLF